MTILRVYLDESGALASADDAVVLAGIAWRTPVDRRHLRRQIRDALPGVAGPPHAAHLHTASFRPMAIDPDGNAPDAVHRAAGLISDARAPDVVAARDRIAERPPEARWRLELDPFQVIDRWLARVHPGCSRALRAVVEHHDANLWALLGSYADHAYAVAAWCPAGPAPAADRYVDLLDTLVERVAQLCSGAAPPASLVRPSACTHAPHVVAGVRVHGTAPTVHRILVREPDHYGPRSHPAFFLADFIANRLRKRVLWPDEGWETTVALWRGHTTLPILVAPARAPATPLPTIAACGEPRQVLADIQTGRIPLDGAEVLAGFTPLWAGQQALLWAPHLAPGGV